MIDFGIDICTVLAPSWDPTWGHVDHFFAQDGGTEFIIIIVSAKTRLVSPIARYSHEFEKYVIVNPRFANRWLPMPCLVPAQPPPRGRSSLES